MSSMLCRQWVGSWGAQERPQRRRSPAEWHRGGEDQGLARAEGPAQGLGFLPASEGTFKQKMTRSVILKENSCSGEKDVHCLQCAEWKFIWKWFASESVVSLALSAWLMTHD